MINQSNEALTCFYLFTVLASLAFLHDFSQIYIQFCSSACVFAVLHAFLQLCMQIRKGETAENVHDLAQEPSSFTKWAMF